MHCSLSKFILLILLSLFLLPGIKSQAETTPNRLEPIIVTAEKRENLAQKVAIPLTVITENEIQDRNIRKMSDLALFLPNIQYLQSGRMDGGSFNFRGVGMFGMSVISERSPVLINFDGIPWESRFGVVCDFNNISQVEFLRGPQGTLYGKNAMAGVINIKTKKPSGLFQGNAQGYLEENNGIGANFQINAPVIEEKLFVRLAGNYSKTDGWMTDHTPGGEEEWDHHKSGSLFVKALYYPSDNFELNLQYGLSDIDAAAVPFVVGKDLSYDITTNFTNPEMKATTHNAAMDLSGNFDAFDLKAITTFRQGNANSYQYFGFPKYGGFDDIEEYTLGQEIRFSSPPAEDNSKFKWLAGIYAANEQSKRNTSGYSFDMSYYGLGVTTSNDPSTIDSQYYATFGEITFPLVSEKLTMTLGGRYEYVARDMEHHHQEYDEITKADLIASQSYNVSDSWDVFLGKAGLNYHLNDKTMFYATLAQGYMPGGFNYIETDPDAATFDAQHSLDYELGAKFTLFSNKLIAGVNFFYTEYNDLQVSQEASPMKFVVVNAGEAHAQGVEVDFSYRPIHSLHLYGSIGLIEAVYDDFEENIGTGSVKYNDNHMTNTPEYTLDLGITYRKSNGFFVAADYHRLGKTYFSKDNSAHFSREELDLVNMKIGWEFASSLNAYLYVRNLFDKEYFTETVEEYDLFMMGEPRVVGFQISYRF